MKLKLFLPLMLILQSTHVISEDCDPDCTQTEYRSYVECIQKRIKRSISCPYSNDQTNCQDCNCDFCVVNSCPRNCIGCCENTPPCVSRGCCHKTCHSRCKTLPCRSDCRRKCAQKLEAEGVNITSGASRPHNVTTIIHLYNTINNTNIIDVPIDVNSTNHNNITVGFDNEQLDDEEQDEEISEDNCCYVYSSKKCSQINTYPYIKCVQYRKNVCGSVCTAPIVHEQPVRQCSPKPNGLQCKQVLKYIPQPKPTCSYQNVWPYVACGMPQPASCGGCYEHYNTQKLPSGCPYSCYDEGYGIGPYYRKGPFYRPSYSHTPSCYQIGTCSFDGSWNQNYPVYGNSFYPVNPYQPNVILGNNYPKHPNQNTTNTYYYSIPTFPPQITSGYPYPPTPPVYILPPEVDIQAIITHPENPTTYAQITISKPGHEDEILSADNE